MTGREGNRRIDAGEAETGSARCDLGNGEGGAARVGSVWESVLLLAAATFPKLRPVGFAARTAGVAPVPDRERFSVELEASLRMARFPLMLPLDWGLKSTVKLVL